jgi:hypothetical protein
MKITSSTVYSISILLVIAISIGVAGLIRVRSRGPQAIAKTDSPTFRNEVSKTQRTCGASVDTTPNGNRIVSYNGVSFDYPVSLASEVESEIKPASFLISETDKPEGVVPAHTAFTFKGSYGSRHKSSFFTPEIDVYNIQHYKQALAVSTAYVQSLESDLQSLKAILDGRPPSLEREVPFLPFGTDATQAFVSNLKYVDFKNGRGLVFLTQFNIEPSLVNNQGLTYVFQGLTDDGLNYVSARFPVTLSFLPPDYQSKGFGEYSVSAFYGRDQKSNDDNYKLYLETIKRRLDGLPTQTFQPNLKSVENLIGSLCVTPE